ncbi:DUF4129 domain-containing protein [soil metagenome]
MPGAITEQPLDADSLTIRLRPRSGWEAIDLGTRLTLANARQVWSIWFAVVLPVAAAVAIVAQGKPWIVALVLWLLKPLFDRFVLQVLAQSVFGQATSVLATLRSWRSLLSPGLPGQLLWRRWDPARSFQMPVNQLERQLGKPAARRRAVLGRMTWGHAVALTFICLLLTSVVMFGLISLISMLTPETALNESTGPAIENEWWENWTWMHVVAQLAATSVMEPVYVGAGFGLYLNRRIRLEGWDVEVALRRLERRLADAVPARAAASVLLALALTIPGAGVARPVRAQTPAAAAVEPIEKSKEKLAIERVLANSEFGGKHPVERWMPKLDDEKVKVDPQAKVPPFWLAVFSFLGKGIQVVAWIAVIVIVAFIVRAILRHFVWNREVADRYRPPDQLFGLVITPASLPDDVASAVRDLLALGNVRAALSLLYRASLSLLVHQHHVRLEAGSTEGDALRAARAELTAAQAGAFEQLLRAWSSAAYAARVPQATEVSVLCDDWARQFGRRDPADAGPT